jgi:DNA-binding transcriptional MerR regulator
MRAKAAEQKDNSAAIAAQFGTSLKALRLYERLGMLKPARTRAGWRVFAEADIARLHVILSLKQLGLPLARIAELIKAGKTDLAALLSMQEEMLVRSRCEAEHALMLIRIAKERVRGRKSLTADELATLVRKISGTVVRWTPELDRLAIRTFTPEQMSKMRSHDDPAAAARLSERWEQIQAELDLLMLRCTPSSEDALDAGRRLVGFFRELSGGDKALWNANAQFWQDAANDPQIAGQLQSGNARYAFVGAILAELSRLGEIRF